ncbi:MAG: HNH endonuclease [Planctomycetes bacterium]|nr:HNH endonuclease [Planctomycetota bacterium]
MLPLKTRLPMGETEAGLMCGYAMAGKCPDVSSDGVRCNLAPDHRNRHRNGLALWGPITRRQKAQAGSGMNASIERFAAKVSPCPITGCMWWMGTVDRHGYGKFFSRGRTWKAHRFAIVASGRDLVPDLDVDHICRHRWCVNPAHLEQVTRRENSMRGMGVGALNAAKTSCPNGHVYNEANTYLMVGRYGGNRRCCRACNREVKRLAASRRQMRDSLSAVGVTP